MNGNPEEFRYLHVCDLQLIANYLELSAAKESRLLRATRASNHARVHLVVLRGHVRAHGVWHQVQSGVAGRPVAG